MIISVLASFINFITILLNKSSLYAIISTIFLLTVLLFNKFVGYYSIGIFSLFLLSLFLYFSTKQNSLKTLGFLGIIIILMLTTLHKIPGIHNPIIFKNLSLSKISSKFNMYINFDNFVIASILYNYSKQYYGVKNNILTLLDIKSIFITFFILLTSLFLISYQFKYTILDFKIPPLHILSFWIFNNLVFVCFSEEIFYRFFLQNIFKNTLKNKYLAIFFASLIFATKHYLFGGWKYFLLSFIAGIFYGYIYTKTNKIMSSILLHFLINFTHFIFFAYPFKE